MKIGVAQTRPITGDIQHNISRHMLLTDLAASYAADAIIFPELSLTGYEPTMAEALAIDPDDSRLDDFQRISNTRQITIGAGIPTKANEGICITMVFFQPNQARQTYSKKYLHPDEEPFFISGQGLSGLKINQTPVALAICYELSVPEHAANAFKDGAAIYIASVAKSAAGMEKAFTSLSGIAKQYSATVLMSNCVGHCDDFDCGGKTSIWNDQGLLAGQLSDTDEGILIIDTDTQVIFEKTI